MVEREGYGVPIGCEPDVPEDVRVVAGSFADGVKLVGSVLPPCFVAVPELLPCL